MPRPLLLLALVGLAVAGCASTDRPVLVPDPSVAEEDPVEPPLAEPAGATDSVRALITPTGVVVGVLAEEPRGYLVRTPCGGEAHVSWGTPLRGADIVLDPGHGGDVESGAVGPNGLVERDLNLALARSLATELGRRGISAALTRTSDYRVPLGVRAELADRLGPRALVSIHHNGPTPSPSSRPGTEVFVQEGVEESRRLGGLIWEHVVAALERFDVEWSAASDAGVLVVRRADGEVSYGMLRYPSTPAVLAELAYLSNPSEAALLASPEYQAAATTALADAIEAWLRTDAPGSGYVDQPRTFTPSGATGGPEGCVDPVLE